MPLPLKSDFKPGIPIVNQLTADWCNTVADFLNHLEGAGATRVEKPTRPSRVTPVRIVTTAAAQSPET